MSEDKNKAADKAIPMAVIVGGFVWIVMDSLVFGGLAGFATYVLIQRDAKEEEGE